MTANADLVSQLTEAANDPDKFSDAKKRRLLEEAIQEIRELRKSAGIRPTTTVRDALDLLVSIAGELKSKSGSADRSRTALLDAAVMLRDLYDRVSPV